MGKREFLGIAAIALMAISASEGFSSVQGTQNRIPQEVVINGQTVTAASVTTAQGQIQSYTCSSPQHYVAPDGASQGWACYEQTTGVWLLNAVPPAQAQSAPVPAPAAAPAPLPQQPVPQQAPPVYQQRPAPVYQTAPPVIYQQPGVIYQQPVIYPQGTVIYQQVPAVIYQQPVVYGGPVYAPYYSPSVYLGAAAINAVGSIASAAIIGSRYPGFYYPVRGPFRVPVRTRGWRG